MTKPAPPNSPHLEVLASYVHGHLTAFHILGLVHNLRRGNKLDVALHAGWLIYDAWATSKHLREVRKNRQRC